jgi:signal transduction histidine kinase/CheY-like chemotaxis protein
MLTGCFPGVVLADWLPVRAPLVHVNQVRALTPDEAGTAWPVRVTGVVTYISPRIYDFWLQDETAGVYVHPTDLASGLAVGDRIELIGKTDPGAFSPCLSATQIVRLGSGKMPEPLPFDLNPEESRWLESQWVQVWARVRAVRIESGCTRLEVFNAHGTGVILLPGEHLAGRARALVDHEVSVRGVCMPTFTNRVVSGPPKIFTTQLPCPFSESSSTGPAKPARIIDFLLGYAATPHPASRKAILTGTVTASPVPGVLVLQDETYAATIWPQPLRPDVPVGSRVEVNGLVRIEGSRVSLTNAKLTVLGKGTLPPANPITGSEFATGFLDARLVSLEGTVDGVRAAGNWTAIVLVSGAVRFEAYAPGAPEANGFDRLRTGSRVSVAGVPLDADPSGKPGTDRSLYLPNAEALTVLQTPPEPSWWTARRVTYVFACFLTVAVCGSVWLLVLRLQVRRAAGEIKKQYEEKARLERQLREAAKLEAVGRLAGGIAHDFNNLLTVINGCADLLADDPALTGGRAADLARDILQAGERAAALTSQLLTFSRKREVPISAVNLNEVVSDTVRLLDRVIGEMIAIQTTFAPDLPPVCGAPGLLHQVVMNLAVNAKDAMPAGGTLSLSTARLVDTAPGAPLHEYVRLTVSDTGMGMTDEVKTRLFEPFFTTKEVGSGTGLGLATVYGIVQAIRGRIGFESAIGRGTSFYIDLRLHGEPTPFPTPPTCRPVRNPSGALKLAGATIMVVEDNAMVRNLIVDHLTTDGATVLSAENPSQALRVLADYPRSVDAMVTDVVMPGMSGRKLADQVRRERPTVRVMYMSGYTTDEVLREGVLADQVVFLQKPFTPDHLSTRLVELLGSKA